MVVIFINLLCGQKYHLSNVQYTVSEKKVVKVHKSLHADVFLPIYCIMLNVCEHLSWRFGYV